MVFIVEKAKEAGQEKQNFDDAINITGFGKYNLLMLTSCSLLIVAMYMDIFGYSIALPAVACDMALTTTQQGLLSAMPLIGVMFSSYGWGLCADTLGRRKTLLIAMPVGVILNLAATMVPNYTSLAIIKFLSASFTSSANAAAFVLLGESAPGRFRSRFMFLMAGATMLVQFIIAIIALPVFKLTFNINISWLSLDYRPWRLLLQLICIPGIIGTIAVFFLKESPKFLLTKGKTDESLDVMKTIFSFNTGLKREEYPVTSMYLDEMAAPEMGKTFLHKMWNQTVPLFKPPLLKNSLKLYFILLCAYMTSTGYTMWVPTMTNAYFDGDDATGKTFCEVASTAASVNSTTTDCNNVIQPLTLYAVMCYSGGSWILNILQTFLVDAAGKKLLTVAVFAICAVCGVLLFFIRIPMLSIALFYIFLYVCTVLGNINTYLIELNPTYLRGMATCLSVVVARGFGFFSVQIIARLLADNCIPMISGYVVLVISGLVVALFLPPDNVRSKGTTDTSPSKNTDVERL